MKHLKRTAAILSFAASLWIVLAVLFVGKNAAYPEWAKTKSLLPNGVLLVLYAGILVGMIWCIRLFRSKSPRFSKFLDFLQKYYSVFLTAGCIGLLAAEWYISWQMLFYAGWDVSIVSGSADHIWKEGGGIGNFYYYSQYTNNIAIVSILSLVRSIYVHGRELLGQYYYFATVWVGCLQITLAGAALAGCVRQITGSRLWALFSFAWYAKFIGINPWMVVPYTDTYTILFPILTIYLYIQSRKAQGDKRKLFFLFLAGLAGGYAYLIKPPAVIALLAVVIAELLELVFGCAAYKRILSLFRLFMLAVSALVVFSIWQGMLEYSGVIRNPDIALSPTHYLMMGLNEGNNGAYNAEDYGFTSSQPNRTTARKENLRVVKERLREMGPGGYAVFMGRKQLLNYNDGTFAWGQEGGFEIGRPLVEQTLTRQRLERVLRTEGDFYCLFATYVQGHWVLILTGMSLFLWQLIGSLYGNTTQNAAGEDAGVVMAIALLGTFLYVMLFEARARYLYNMSPVFLLAGVLGIRRVVEVCARKVQESKRTNRENKKN